MAAVDFHADALAEAEAARGWYEQQRPFLGDAFSDAIEAAVEAVSETPSLWPADEAGARRCPLRRFPYSLIYVLLSVESIVVLAVAHQRRAFASKPPSFRSDRSLA